MIIFHITTEKLWNSSKNEIYYDNPSLNKEGFIHASTKMQVLKTLNRIFKGRSDLLLLELDTNKIGSKIIYEFSKGSGEKHPHIYGKLLLKSVKRVYKLNPDKDGVFRKIDYE